jgi:DNA polymerase (family X)
MSLNQAVSERLEQMAQMLELLGENAFKIRAYARASSSVLGLSTDVSELARDKARLMEIEGIGGGIADKIIEFVTTGTIGEYEALRKKVPPGLIDVLRVPGMGPKTVQTLWKERGVATVADLKRIIEDGSILTVPRMGEKTVENIKKSLEFARTSGVRLPLGLASQIAELVMTRLRAVKGVAEVVAAGSLRRGRDTIGDIDLLAMAADPAAASEAFRAMPEVVQVLAGGETKSSVRFRLSANLGRWARSLQEDQTFSGPTIQVDFRVIPAAQWGAALLYFTGSKQHNIRLRDLAIKKGFTLNEYGLFKLDDDPTPPQNRGVKAVAAKTEESVYTKLGLPWLPPEVREDAGELSLKETPRLVEVDEIKAELHAHTTASDGAMSIEELARRAKERGFHTVAVTDHSQGQPIANGLSPDRLREHIEAVRKANEKVKGVRVLAGSEVDILADGSLDYADDLLAELDIVVASPHAALSQDPEAATKRLLRAIANPLVHILGHPTGRLINRRPGLSPDMARVIAAAKEHGVALEINAHWMRLDLRDTHVRAAVDAGCLIAIDCDTHSPEDLENLRFGIATARRGWVTPELCVNAWPAKKLHAWLASKRGAKKPPRPPAGPARAKRRRAG